MKLLADLHTHSNYSRFHHGKNKIEEMAIEANEIGLVEIGITDHGYSHFFRTSKQKIKQARKIIDEINTWSKTKVLLGVEADIISEDGTLDIDNETLSMLDILIIGYHKMIFTDFANFFGKSPKTEEAKRKCTNAYINAINKYPVTIVSHLDSILTTDLYEIGKACKERGTMVEINNRHTKWTAKQVEDLIASDCMFVLSSDAHSREKVGDVKKAMEYITKYNIPSERVANVEFMEDEKSEEDKSFSAYKSVYEQIAKEKRDKQEKIDEKVKTQITGNISAEMEDKLRQIALGKGLNYEEVKKEKVEDGYMKDMSDENLKLIAQAEEYIKNNSFETIKHENEAIQSVDGEDETQYRFDDNHPLMKNFDNFEDRFQSINSVINNENPKDDIGDRFVLDKHEEKIEVQVVQEETIQNNIFESIKQEKNESENKSAFEQLSSSSISPSRMDEFRKMLSENKEFIEEKQSQNNVQKQQFQKVAPENFMDSITQTRLVNNTKSEPEKPKEKEPEKKVIKEKNTKRGAFIVVDNLIDGDKK